MKNWRLHVSRFLNGLVVLSSVLGVAIGFICLGLVIDRYIPIDWIVLVVAIVCVCYMLGLAWEWELR